MGIGPILDRLLFVILSKPIDKFEGEPIKSDQTEKYVEGINCKDISTTFNK